jgi:hypothetical protein
VTPKDKKSESSLPPVSEMVTESIMALKDPPRKGSTLRAIKETIALNWPVKLIQINFTLLVSLSTKFKRVLFSL